MKKRHHPKSLSLQRSGLLALGKRKPEKEEGGGTDRAGSRIEKYEKEYSRFVS